MNKPVLRKSFEACLNKFGNDAQRLGASSSKHIQDDILKTYQESYKVLIDLFEKVLVEHDFEMAELKDEILHQEKEAWN